MGFRIGGHASVEFRVGGHARWLRPPIVVDKSISARIVLARGSTFGVSVVIWRSRKRLFFYGLQLQVERVGFMGSAPKGQSHRSAHGG